MYGKGKQLDKDYYEIMEGVKMFFYDSESIKQDFKNMDQYKFRKLMNQIRIWSINLQSIS